MPRNDGYNPTAEQQQNMDNLSFDRKYLVNAVEILTENAAGTEVVRQKPLATSSNQTDGSQKTQIVETLPDDSTKLNPAISCTRNANGYVTVLTMTANGVTKTKTITRDVNDYWTNIGEWV